MDKKGEREILVISSQDTRTTIPKITHPHMVKVSIGMLPDFQASTADQPVTARPTTQPVDLVDQLQNLTIEKPVVVHVIDPQPDIVVISVGPSTVLVKAVVKSAATTPLSNPNTTTTLLS